MINFVPIITSAMLSSTLTTLFTRDLNKLRSELEQYHNETTIWKTDKNIANSAGNLCLHLIGNLNHFIGSQLGNTGYVRNREQEFALKNVPRTELLEMIGNTISMIAASLSQLKEEDLEKEYPLLVFAEKTSTGFFLVHLSTHLAYHLGQINYHRRLLDVD